MSQQFKVSDFQQSRTSKIQIEVKELATIKRNATSSLSADGEDGGSDLSSDGGDDGSDLSKE